MKNLSILVAIFSCLITSCVTDAIQNDEEIQEKRGGGFHWALCIGYHGSRGSEQRARTLVQRLSALPMMESRVVNVGRCGTTIHANGVTGFAVQYAVAGVVFWTLGRGSEEEEVKECTSAANLSVGAAAGVEFVQQLMGTGAQTTTMRGPISTCIDGRDLESILSTAKSRMEAALRDSLSNMGFVANVVVGAAGWLASAVISSIRAAALSFV